MRVSSVSLALLVSAAGLSGSSPTAATAGDSALSCDRRGLTEYRTKALRVYSVSRDGVDYDFGCLRPNGRKTQINESSDADGDTAGSSYQEPGLGRYRAVGTTLAFVVSAVGADCYAIARSVDLKTGRNVARLQFNGTGEVSDLLVFGNGTIAVIAEPSVSGNMGCRGQDTGRVLRLQDSSGRTRTLAAGAGIVPSSLRKVEGAIEWRQDGSLRRRALG